MLWRLIQFSIWYTFACGVFALIVPHMMVNDALVSLGERASHIVPDNTYVIAVSVVRVAGVLFLAMAMVMKLLIRQGWSLDDLKLTLTMVAINFLIWGGSFVFLLSTRSAITLSICGIPLLLWLIIPSLLIFEYKKPDEWKSA